MVVFGNAQPVDWTASISRIGSAPSVREIGGKKCNKPEDLAYKAVNAWNAMDAAKIAGLFCPDASLVCAGLGPEIVGRPAIQGMYAAMFAGGFKDSRAHMTNVKATMYGKDVALVSGDEHVALADGTKVVFHVIATGKKVHGDWFMHRVFITGDAAIVP